MPVYNFSRPYEVQELITNNTGSGLLSDAYADVVAYRTSIGRIYPCPKCATTGVHALSLDTNSSGDTQLVECTFVSSDNADNACLGWGMLAIPVVADRASTFGLYIDAP